MKKRRKPLVPSSPPRSNYILSERELKRLVKRAYWKGANLAHPGDSITIGEVTELDAAFDLWWKVNR